MPPGGFDALLLTSAQAAMLAGAGAPRHLPAYVVGEATATAARAAGFEVVRIGGGDAAAAIAGAARDGRRRLLHLAGRDRTAPNLSPGVEIVVREVYAAELVPELAGDAVAALRARPVDWALLFSARTAAHFAALVDGLGVARSAIGVAAISPAALAAAGEDWARAVAAERPDEAHVLAAAGLLCEKPN